MKMRNRLGFAVAALILSVSLPTGSSEAQTVTPCPDNYCLDAWLHCIEWGHGRSACDGMESWCDEQCELRAE